MKNQHLFIMLCAMLVFAGCTKDPLADLTEENSKIYITDFDSTANFTAATTFSISDSVTVVSNGSGTKALTAQDRAFIDATKQQLQTRGYSLVNRTASPDLGVNVSRVYNTTTGIIDYGSYWGPYNSFYDPFYWGYGGYGYYVPYAFGTYRITEGALSIDMLDLKNASATSTINLVWTGLIRGPNIFNETTAANDVKMLFDQSPYLTK